MTEEVTQKRKRKQKYEHSRWIMASYGSKQLFSQWITGPFGLFVFFFYEVEIGLDVRLGALALVIFSFWNAINDPLIGFIMDKIHMPWDTKWGRRFPWVMIFALPWVMTYIAIFYVPLSWNTETALLGNPIWENQWKVFWWLLISICLYDTFLTIWDVNHNAIYPDKFRGMEERRTAAGFGTVIGMTGIVVASIIPPMLRTQGIPESYRTMSWMIGAVAFFLFFLMIPGSREDKKTIAKNAERREIEAKLPKSGFFKTAGRVFSNKRFVLKALFFFGYQAAVALLSASAPYTTGFIMGNGDLLMYVMAAMLLGALVSVPFWVLISNKVKNNKGMSVVAGFMMTAALALMFFLPGEENSFSLFYWIGGLFIFGITLGGQWFVDPPLMASVLDDAAIKLGRREDTVYYGYQAFFARLGTAVQAGIFALVHTLTGFPAGVNSLAELKTMPGWETAVLGIRLHTSLIPASLTLIMTILFWIFFDLTKEKEAENRKKILELGLL
jgi:glycoside/pentoside/hexuronide:cation symporter, GPH family